MFKKLPTALQQKNKASLLTLFFFFTIFASFAQQQITVNGSVFTEDDTPLTGVSVKVKGSSGGATTDSAGRFSIQVNRGATLVLSFVGFEEKQVLVNNDKSVGNIIMILSIGEISCNKDLKQSMRYSPGLLSMQHIETLPFLYDNGTQTRQFSSYDPSGGNIDGSFTNAYTKYIDDNGEYVIFDASGPGCLYRQQYNIWSMGRYMGGSNAHIKYYFDNETAPRLDVGVNDLFGGKVSPFISPYAYLDSGGVKGQPRFGILYYPFAFKNRLKITTNYDFNKIRPGGNYGHSWYQFTYCTFAQGYFCEELE
jgi:hypothetical protein